MGLRPEFRTGKEVPKVVMEPSRKKVDKQSGQQKPGATPSRGKKTAGPPHLEL
jgi:hypothetical protein